MYGFPFSAVRSVSERPSDRGGSFEIQFAMKAESWSFQVLILIVRFPDARGGESGGESDGSMATLLKYLSSFCLEQSMLI